MGERSASKRRVWARRSCRAAGGGGVVTRTVEVPASGASTVRRRTEGFAHIDKQRHVHGVLSDFRCSSGPKRQEDNFSSGIGEFKHKKSYMSSTGENTNLINRALLHGSHTVSDDGSQFWPRYRLNKLSNSVKNTQAANSSCSGSNFSHQLVRNAERSASMKMSSTHANYSLSEKMSLLRQQSYGGSHENQSHFRVLNRRYKIVNSGGAINYLSQEKLHDQADSSLGRHSQALFNNALVRHNKLGFLESPCQKTPEQSWSSACCESDKAVCFSSGDSVDELQASSSSDTSDNSNLSSLGTVANDQWKMTFKKVYCPVAARIDPTSVMYHKDRGQASPVSVLELPEDCSDSENTKQEPADPYDLRLRLELVKFPTMKTAAEMSSIGGISDDLSSEMESNYDEPIQLVEDIIEEFEDEEEREFSYWLDVLIASGIHGTAEDQLYKVCQSLDCPAGNDVFEKLEKKYIKLLQWSRSDRKLLFDMLNTILSQILAPCLDMQPWVNTASSLTPMWGYEGLLEKVLQVLAQRREELALSKAKPERKVFDQKWPDLSDCIDRAGREIEKMIKDDLLEELVLELLSS